MDILLFDAAIAVGRGLRLARFDFRCRQHGYSFRDWLMEGEGKALSAQVPHVETARAKRTGGNF